VAFLARAGVFSPIAAEVFFAGLRAGFLLLAGVLLLTGLILLGSSIARRRAIGKTF
jgi:hypothetical protein